MALKQQRDRAYFEGDIIDFVGIDISSQLSRYIPFDEACEKVELCEVIGRPTYHGIHRALQFPPSSSELAVHRISTYQD